MNYSEYTPTEAQMREMVEVWIGKHFPADAGKPSVVEGIVGWLDPEGRGTPQERYKRWTSLDEARLNMHGAADASGWLAIAKRLNGK